MEQSKLNTESMLQNVVNVKDVYDDLKHGEYVKKPDLARMGRFNLVGVAERSNTYKGKTTQQYVFEVQLLDGENRGARALVSMDQNIVRTKYAKIVRAHGGVGPLTLKLIESNESEAYVFEPAGDEPVQPELSLSEVQSDNS